MALSDADLDAAWTKARSKNGPQWVPHFEALRAVEAEARRDALEEAAKVCESMHEEDRPGDYAYAIRKLKEDTR